MAPGDHVPYKILLMALQRRRPPTSRVSRCPRRRLAAGGRSDDAICVAMGGPATTEPASATFMASDQIQSMPIKAAKPEDALAIPIVVAGEIVTVPYRS